MCLGPDRSAGKIRSRDFLLRLLAIVSLEVVTVAAECGIVSDEFSKQRNVSQTGLGPMLDFETFRALIGSIDHRQVQLKPEAFVEGVTRDELCNLTA